jgi:hypothetical protein
MKSSTGSNFLLNAMNACASWRARLRPGRSADAEVGPPNLSPIHDVMWSVVVLLQPATGAKNSFLFAADRG